MNWPHIIIAAGISAWLHGIAAAACKSVGLNSFGLFATLISVASSIVFAIGLIARAVNDSDETERRAEQKYTEKLAHRMEQWDSSVRSLDERVKKLEKAQEKEKPE